MLWRKNLISPFGIFFWIKKKKGRSKVVKSFDDIIVIASQQELSFHFWDK